MKIATNIITGARSNPPERSNIDDLVSRAQKGDESAFNDLIHQFYPIVHRRVWHMVPRNAVEDTTQEVFAAAARSLKNFRGEAKFSTWLHTIISYQVANYYRKRERRPNQTDNDIEDFSEILPAQRTISETEWIDEMISLKSGLSKLPEEYQEIILIRLVEGFKFREIAENLGINLDAAKSRFRRALKALQREVGNPNE